MVLSALLLLHLVGFAAFLGAAFAQQQFMKMSARAGLGAAIRDEYERLAASILTKVELPGLFAQVLTGVATLVLAPEFLKQHWMHAKLTAVVVLLVLAHVEMFNARNIVKLRPKSQSSGDAADTEIVARKKRHAAMGAIGTVMVAAIVLLVTVLRNAF